MAVADRLRAELLDIRERFGADAGDLLPREIVDLVDACRMMEEPFEKDNLAIIDFPYTLPNGENVYAISIGARIWLDGFAARWWRNVEMVGMYEWSMYYAMAIPRDDRNAFLGLTDRRTAFKKITKWAMRETATKEDFERAFEHFYGRTFDEDEDGEPEKTTAEDPEELPDSRVNKIDYAETIAILEGETGIPADEWLWGRSALATAATFQQCMRLVSAKGGAKYEGIEDGLNEAVNRLAKIKRRIYLRLKKGKEEK